jgi:hypothetical protein
VAAKGSDVVLVYKEANMIELTWRRLMPRVGIDVGADGVNVGGNEGDAEEH